MSKATESTDEEVRWTRLKERDPSARWSFLYAVRTTGIFCRPGCASRLPRRENVIFFDRVDEAKSAGYRACKKCHPDSQLPNPKHVDAVRRACELIDQEGQTLQLNQLAATVGYSPTHFQRIFKEMLGVSPKSYAMTRRAHRIRELLLDQSPVAQAVYRSGYENSNRFYEESQEVLGMKASEYRKGAAGIALHVAVTTTSLGKLLVAATEKGLCAIEFGESEAQLWSWFHTKFPEAKVVDSADFRQWLTEVCAFVENPNASDVLPLDIRGTAFQRLVWEQLRKIPVGSTTTYAELAKKIGRPTATRAVAGACAANQLAVVIPCHRVLRSDGGMGGYRWGVPRKVALIERESSA